MKQKFLKVRPDPFTPTDTADLYVLRIEAYPDAEDKFFSLKIWQGNTLVKEETCHFDERGQVEVIPMKDAYDKILTNYRKTHIPRRIRADERHSGVVEDTFF